MKKPTKPDASDKDPLLDAAEVGEQEMRDLFREVSVRVRYPDFAELAWERFRAWKRLAMLDLWSEASDEDKARQVGLPVADLSEIRQSEVYARLQVALTQAFQEASSPRKATEWVAAMEDAAFRRLALIARHSLDPRVAAAAARDFADRALPKVSRNKDDESAAPVLMITEDGARLLFAALETVRRKSPEALGPAGEGS